MISEQIRQKAREWHIHNDFEYWSDEEVAAFAESLLSGGAATGMPAEATYSRSPDGYAYRYHSMGGMSGGTEIRFNCGEQVNGGKPIEVIPYYLGAAPPAASGGQHSVIATKNTAELLQAASGRGIPAMPSTPQLRPQVPEWDYESQHEREKAIMDLQEKREEAAVAAAVEREREECAELLMERCRAFNGSATAYARGGAQDLREVAESKADLCARLAEAIRSRASQPSAPTPECLDYPACDGMLAGEPHVKECPMYKSVEPQGGKEANARPGTATTGTTATGASSPSGASGLLAPTPRCPKCGHTGDENATSFWFQAYGSDNSHCPDMVRVSCQKCKRQFVCESVADFWQFFPASSGRDPKELAGRITLLLMLPGTKIFLHGKWQGWKSAAEVAKIIEQEVTR